MALNGSGTISIGGSTTGQSINLELGRAATASSNLNETALRNLANVASGAIDLADFYGKSAVTYFHTGLMVSRYQSTGYQTWQIGWSSGIAGSSYTTYSGPSCGSWVDNYAEENDYAQVQFSGTSYANGIGVQLSTDNVNWGAVRTLAHIGSGVYYAGGSFVGQSYPVTYYTRAYAL